MDRQSPLHVVSVKGVVIRDGRVVLLRNERDEWELPGGKLERGEDPMACLMREVAEEVGWDVTIGPILDAWQYHIRDGCEVLIITYGCATTSTHAPRRSAEHTQIGLFTQDEVTTLRLPLNYKRSITNWYAKTS